MQSAAVEVYQTLLERGVCLCSVSTMHRILREHGENGERRDQRAAQHNAIPRLIAQAPNEVWTWDCSKLATRARSVYLTLRNGPTNLDSAVSEIFLGFQAANSVAAWPKYTASGVRRSSALCRRLAL